MPLTSVAASRRGPGNLEDAGSRPHLGGSEPVIHAERRDRTMTTHGPAWDAAALAHRTALAAYVARAGRLTSARWSAPRAPGKWSPAEVSEHLALSYEVGLAELRGGPALSVRTSFWQRAVLRWFVMPKLLAGGALTRPVKAPMELRHPVAGEQVATLARLEQLAATLERELDTAAARGPVRFTHPYFGALDAVQVLGFCAFHARHHEAQVAEGE